MNISRRKNTYLASFINHFKDVFFVQVACLKLQFIMATIMETTNDVCLMLIGCFVVSVSGIQFEFDCNLLFHNSHFDGKLMQLVSERD